MAPSGPIDETRFFQRLAAALLVATLLAFSTTYLLPLSAGRFSGPAILHLHGLTFLLWPMLYLAQTISIGRSRRWHRAIGLTGISLATAMVILGLAVIASSIRSWQERGVALEGQGISIIAFSGLAMFAGFFVAAVASTRNRAAHSRLMTLATLAIMQAVSGRLLLTVVLGGNPDMLRPGLLPPAPLTPIMVPHLAFDLIVLAVLAFHDRRVLGRIHRVTLIGGAIVLAVHGSRHLFAGSDAWNTITLWLLSL
jgi:hypothetical protein